MRLGHRLHRKQMLLSIEKDQPHDRSRRRELRETLHAQGLALDSLGVAEPVRLDTKFFPGLV